MHSYLSLFSRTLRNSTAVVLITISSFSAFAMEGGGEGENSIKRYAAPSSYKAVKFSLNPSVEADAIERDKFGKPWRVYIGYGQSTTHQLESDRFSVQPDDIIQIHYKITILEGGKIALGLWNTNKDGWYGEEVGLRAQIIDLQGNVRTLEGSFERKVPVGETETSLVLRNDHREMPGHTTFIINDMDIQKKNAHYLYSTGLPVSLKQAEDGKLIVTTDYNDMASYQLTTDRFSVEPDDLIKTHYKVTVQPGGKMSLGFLNTNRNDWYGEELILGEGSHKGIYTSIVPTGEKESSLIFRNYHLGTPGQTTFTIEYLDMQKEWQDKSIFSKMPMTVFSTIIQQCSLQETRNFLSTSKKYNELCNSPEIWTFLMQKHYPTMKGTTKNDFMASHLEYGKFGNLESCTIKVKNLIQLLNAFPPNSHHERFFAIGNNSFALKAISSSAVLEGRGAKYQRVDSHRLELLDPEANVIFKYADDSFLAYLFVNSEPNIVKDFNFTTSNSHPQYLRDFSRHQKVDENHRSNYFRVKCVNTHGGNDIRLLF